MRFPEGVIFAIARDCNGKANPITIGWTMPVSFSPDIMAIVVNSERYSAEAVRHSKCFTIVFPSEDMTDAALFFGSKTGRDTDKLAEADVVYEPASKIDSVILTDAVANFECELESEITKAGNIVFFGNVVASHVNTYPQKRLYTLSIDKGYHLGGV